MSVHYRSFYSSSTVSNDIKQFYSFIKESLVKTTPAIFKPLKLNKIPIYSIQPKTISKNFAILNNTSIFQAPNSYTESFVTLGEFFLKKINHLHVYFLAMENFNKAIKGI